MNFYGVVGTVISKDCFGKPGKENMVVFTEEQVLDIINKYEEQRDM